MRSNWANNSIPHRQGKLGSRAERRKQERKLISQFCFFFPPFKEKAKEEYRLSLPMSNFQSVTEKNQLPFFIKVVAAALVTAQRNGWGWVRLALAVTEGIKGAKRDFPLY